jgi:hypothetical protein
MIANELLGGGLVAEVVAAEDGINVAGTGGDTETRSHLFFSLLGIVNCQ